MAKREAPIAVEVRDGRLCGADPWAEDQIAKLPRGVRFNATLEVAVSRPDDEHGGLLNLYMAGISVLFDHLPITGPGTDYPTPTHLRRHILCEIGFCERIPQRDGTERRIADSMARDKMAFDDLQFCYELSQLYVLRMTEHYIGQPFDPWQLWKDQHPTPTVRR
jgi:hypothetical protein